MRRRAVAIALASLTLSVVPIAASHAAASHGGPRLCTWGGTPANPTGIVTFDPGITNTPSAGPIATHAWGPLEGPGCQGIMDFSGIGRCR